MKITAPQVSGSANCKSAILGVDAAWTSKEPSGIALIQKESEKYRIVKLGRSYQEFTSDQEGLALERPKGTMPDFNALLLMCDRLGHKVNVVALDIPLSNEEINGRRLCDNEISRVYATRKASTHSPNVNRPGPISNNIRDQLSESGFKLALESGMLCPIFMEIYPHTAIIELFNLEERLKYKVSRRSKYWPQLSPEERIREIICNLNRLYQYLNSWFTNLDKHIMPMDSQKQYPIWEIKGQEDCLDALVSALTGGLYLEGKIKAYGDKTGVIWVPHVE